MPHGLNRSKATCLGHTRERAAGAALQLILSKPHPFAHQPLARGDACRFAKTPLECSTAHVDLAGEALDRVRLVEVLADPVEEIAKPRSMSFSGNRPFDELGLAAVAMRRHHETPRNGIG